MTDISLLEPSALPARVETARRAGAGEFRFRMMALGAALTVLAIFAEMEQGARRYLVTSDLRQSDLQRDSLLAAADKRGMPIVRISMRERKAALPSSSVSSTSPAGTPAQLAA